MFQLKGAQIETVQWMLSQNSVNETYVIYLLLYNEAM